MSTIVSVRDFQWDPETKFKTTPTRVQEVKSTAAALAPISAKIVFERMVLEKDKKMTAPEGIKGALSITEDDNHVGFIHIWIWLSHIINALLFSHNRDYINFCHSEIIIGKNDAKPGHLKIAHSLPDGLRTTSENHEEDKVISRKHFFKPVDERIQNYLVKYAEQTAVYFKKVGLDPKKPDFEERRKKLVNPFSYWDGFISTFYNQVVKPQESVQRNLSNVVADLIRGDKLRNDKGELDSIFCTAYMLSLIQATTLITTFTDEEIESLKTTDRKVLADMIYNRIKDKENAKTDLIAARYWQNEFMQLDPRHSLAGPTAEVLVKASRSKSVENV